MTSKRKAEIQRKLSLASVPRPPAGLGERIKNDIPKYLNADAERDRLSQSLSSNLRVAAAVIVLVSAAGAMLFVLGPDAPEGKSEAVAVVEPQAARSIEDAPAPARETAAADEAQSTAVVAEPATVVQMADATVAPRERRAAPVRVESERPVAGGVGRGVVGGVIGGTVATDAAERAEVVARPAAPAPAPPPPPPPPTVAEAAPAAAAEPAPQPVMADAEAPALSFARNARAAKAAGPQATIFGISVDPEVFSRIKATLEEGRRPAPAAVNVEALVNYFAGPPPRRVRRNVQLEVEASPAPVAVKGQRGILRFTVDTASADIPAGVSPPAVATDARIDIEFNPSAVQHFEPIGDSVSSAPESALPYNASVTGLYALDLRPTLTTSQIVATVRLHYRSIGDGRRHTAVRVLRGADFTKPWPRASRRHRLATLGALWGETLRGTEGGTDVALRAEELASQEPRDARARELAAAATASSGGTR